MPGVNLRRMPDPKIKLVISDFHLSRGKWLKDGRRNPLEDFHQDERFREFLEYYSTGEYTDTDVELIINGDFFDPLAVIPLPGGKWKNRYAEYPKEVTEEAAVDQFKKIIAGHPVSFEALKDFLARGKKIAIRWGNHDAAVLWPKVQDYLVEVFSPKTPTQLTFQKDPYIFDRICVDHGHQAEAFNSFDENQIFIERQTPSGSVKIQNLPFGSFFVLGFLNGLKLQRSFINQISPLRDYVKLSLLLDPWFFFINGVRVFWFFIKKRLITHPMRFSRLGKTLEIIKESFKRPSLEKYAEKILTGSQAQTLPYDTIIMGHNHQATIRIFPNGKQYINTGTWIPITSLDMSTLGHRVLRTYALIEYSDEKATASLKVWHGTPQITEDFS